MRVIRRIRNDLAQARTREKAAAPRRMPGARRRPARHGRSDSWNIYRRCAARAAVSAETLLRRQLGPPPVAGLQAPLLLKAAEGFWLLEQVAEKKVQAWAQLESWSPITESEDDKGKPANGGQVEPGGGCKVLEWI